MSSLFGEAGLGAFANFYSFSNSGSVNNGNPPQVVFTVRCALGAREG